MRKIISLLLILGLLIPNYSFASQPDSSAIAAIVMDTISGRVLYSKNMDQRLPMASTTKVVTAITAIENGNLNDIITTSRNASYTEGSSIWLEENEKISMENALYGLMLSSGNDAATAIAEHISGGEKEFATLMNETAKKAGATNSHFENPHGLDSPGHYTTAYDLALITCYALKNETFKEIVKTESRKIPWQGHEWNRVLKNHNKLLWKYEFADGVKTGFTKKSGRCLVSSATKNGWQLVAVTLNAGDDWNDHIKMLEYAFCTYEVTKVIEKNQYMKSINVINGKTSDKVLLFSKNDFSIPTLSSEKNVIDIKYNGPDNIYAPIVQNQIIGKMEVYLDNKLINSVDLVSNTFIKSYNFKEDLIKVLKNWMYIFEPNENQMF